MSRKNYSEKTEHKLTWRTASVDVSVLSFEKKYRTYAYNLNFNCNECNLLKMKFGELEKKKLGTAIY